MKPELIKLAEGLRNGMFSERDTVPKAVEYALGIAKACGPNEEIYVITAVQVVMNTIAKEILNIVKEDKK